MRTFTRLRLIAVTILSCLFLFTTKTSGQVDLITYTYYDNVNQKAYTSIVVNNFTDVVTTQWTMEYDEDIFEIDTVFSTENLAGITIDNFYFFNNGIITYNWLEIGTAFDGETVPDGTELFRIVSTLKVPETGNFCITGSITPIEITDKFGLLLSHNEYCNLEIGIIKGNVYYDSNSNCQKNNNESSLGNWIVSFTNGSETFYTTSQSDGSYYIFLYPGTYDIELIAKDTIWTSCPTLNNIDLDLNEVLNFDLGAKANQLCPLMEVDLTTNLLRRCFDNKYYIYYANQGTVIANQATLEIELDPFLNYVSSSVPIANQNGQILTFNLGDVQPGESNTFFLEVEVDCDNTVLGQTHCTTATIFPHTPCSGGQEKPILKLSKECNGGEISFKIENTGNQDMTSDAYWLPYKNSEIQTPGVFKLNAGESKIISFQANGDTYTLQLLEGLATSSRLLASLSAEGCGTNGSGNFSTGFVTQFQNSSQEIWTDTDCGENIGSFDPNDKQGFPKGHGQTKVVQPGTEMEYLIRFQNTGTDTAFNVVILDTLTQNFDSKTFRIGASSHQMKGQLLDRGILKFSFENIMLPDSNVNEPASHGFLKYYVKPKKNLPLKTEITNSAAIYFDFNDPIITNETFHTIDETILVLISSDDLYENVSIKAFPNPSSDKITIEILNLKNEELHLNLFDSNGKLVLNKLSTNNRFELAKGEMPKGIYYFNILDLKKQFKGKGKIVFK